MSLALEPLAPIQAVNFPNDRDYTFLALTEELALMERHLRDGSWTLCTCNPEKHLPLVAGLASEGFGFAEKTDEKEFMRRIRDRARIWRDKIQNGKFSQEDADKMRAWARELRHRIEFKQWTGEMGETPELETLAFELNQLSLVDLEEKHVDKIVSEISKKFGVKKPRIRFINNCNPMKDAYQIGRDLLVKGDNGKIERFPLTDLDEIVICRGGGSAYAVAHETCHYVDRVKKGFTSEESATECALKEVENTIFTEKTLNTLAFKRNSGGNMSVVKARPLVDYVPLVVGLAAGEMVDEMGLIESTVGPYASGFTGIAKAAIGAGAMYVGSTKTKGAATDFLVGLGLPLIVSGLKEQFLGATPAPVVAAARAAQPYPYTGLTPYSRPTGLYQGHPTLTPPYTTPRPGILAPPQMTMYQHMQEPALGGKFILGNR